MKLSIRMHGAHQQQNRRTNRTENNNPIFAARAHLAALHSGGVPGAHVGRRRVLAARLQRAGAADKPEAGVLEEVRPAVQSKGSQLQGAWEGQRAERDINCCMERVLPPSLTAEHEMQPTTGCPSFLSPLDATPPTGSGSAQTRRPHLQWTQMSRP